MARSWNDLGLQGRVGNVLVSIDAAKPETYAVIRRGGDFDDLMENLTFLSGLRQANEVNSVRLDFVVQPLNFREMPAATKIMRKFKFDKIKFQMLRSWNTWSAEDFRKNHVGHPGHPEHDELVQILQDPLLAEPDIEWSGFYSLRPKRSASDARSGPMTLTSNTDARQSANLG